MPALLISLGDQLFAPDYLPADVEVYLAEDYGLCTTVKHHKQKLVFFLAAMRAYADELREAGVTVHYNTLQDESSYGEKLKKHLAASDYSKLVSFEVEDKPAKKMLDELASSVNLDIEYLPSPGFTCSRQAFVDYADSKKRLHMADFYKQQRRRLAILMDDDEPQGGQWSFDEDNRKKLPRGVTPPEIRPAEQTRHVQDVSTLVEKTFADHPGNVDGFWWPTQRFQARAWLDGFIDERLESFGPYEDALSTRSHTVFHSALSPLMNCGLLTPKEVIDAVLSVADDMPLQSVEGFVRQVIGWREFIRGVYQTHSEEQDTANFFNHKRHFTQDWHDGTTGIPPLDDTIRTVTDYAWTHHIPRLMVLGNMMTLCEIKPREAHTWFMEKYIDSAEWVMGPNVYGMGLFSDGGVFATKPYICGSNYLLKMSDYKKGDWCDVVDGLYWRFIDKHRDFFAGNPRLALMPRALDRLKQDRKDKIFDLAEQFLAEKTA